MNKNIKITYLDKTTTSETWTQTNLFCPNCGAKGLWQHETTPWRSEELSRSSICVHCEKQYDSRSGMWQAFPMGLPYDLQRLKQLKQI